VQTAVAGKIDEGFRKVLSRQHRRKVGKKMKKNSRDSERLIESLKIQLMGYFDAEDHESAITELRQDVRDCPGTATIFRDGIDRALSDPAVDCVDIVQNAANRNMYGSEQESRKWLADLRSTLFPEIQP
jgi:hypothetical protein